MGGSNYQDQRGCVAAGGAGPARAGRVAEGADPQDRVASCGAGGERAGRVRGYATPAERNQKQRRLQALKTRLEAVERGLAEGRVRVCRGGRRLARTRHSLPASGLTGAEWRSWWDAKRMFICADGEVGKNLGNETIRFHPDEHWLEIKLPAPLAHLANRPHGRYRLGCRCVPVPRGRCRGPGHDRRCAL